MNPFLLSVLSNAMVAVAMAVGVVLLSLRLKRPTVLHLLWLVILIRLFMPPVFDFGLLPVPQTTLVTVEAVGLAVVSGEVLPTSPAVDWTVFLGWSLVGLWVLGSLTVLVVTLIRLRGFKRLIDRATPADPALDRRIEHIAETMGCSRRPRVVMTGAQVSPLVWSALGRPRLVLPRALVTRLSDGQLDTILAHELAHLKRGDDRVRWIELLALIVFWWNPTTWVASRFLRDAEEACCDAMVTQALPAKVEDYAQGLVHTIRHLTTPEPSPLVAASGLGRPALIERRIVTMFAKKNFLPLGLPARLLVILTTVVVLGLSPMLTAREAGAPSDQAISNTEFSGDPITLHLKDADLDDVLSTFSVLTGLDILTEPSLKVKVSIAADRVPWDEVLHQVLTENGLTYSMDGNRLIVRPGEGHVKAAKKDQGLTDAGPENAGVTVFRYFIDVATTEPKRLSGPDPVYPEEARLARIQGNVVLMCGIGEDGRVNDTKIVRGLPLGLTEAAVAAVEQWVFEPALLDGVAIEESYVLTMRFSLE
ncbi:MAG: TonB family protein [Thermoanaerobaculales bacterium]|nr:TonB family protein [Thermoanaerobaculales bacterium]